MRPCIKIGTRKSALAMAQTRLVMEEIRRVHPEVSFQIVTMTTKGDSILHQPLVAFGGKAIFVSELEEALAQGKIDIAVHSAKDMPIELARGLEIVAVLEREDPRDVLVQKRESSKPLNVIGTSSLRRELQIKQYYPEAECRSIRGNIGTRLEKLKAGEYDGIVLAMAGLRRLGLLNENAYELEVFSCDRFPIGGFLPAAGQGIIAIEGRKQDPIHTIVKDINHEESFYCLETERAVLQLLGAGCQEAIAAYSKITGEKMELSVLYEQNGKVVRCKQAGEAGSHLALAAQAVEEIGRRLHE